MVYSYVKFNKRGDQNKRRWVGISKYPLISVMTEKLRRGQKKNRKINKCPPPFIRHLEVLSCKNHAEDEARRLVADLFLFFLKKFYMK